MAAAVKICGIKDSAALKAAETAGAQFVGFVFHPKSPRNISPEDAAALIKQTRLTTVGLFVDPTDEDLFSVLKTAPLNMIQLHGDETPSRVMEIKTLTKKPIMKAIRVADMSDLTLAPNYALAADWLLFDAKVAGATGGTGKTFDWTILKGYKPGKPWMLAGGLNPENVKDALKILSPIAVDVSSGVESAPGVKDAGKIAAFVANVRS